MGFAETLQELFHTDNLYEILDVPPSADSSQIKKGYYKMSLKVHPDRAGPSEQGDATSKFQALARVYKILSDNDSRALYDKYGLDEDIEETESFDEAYEQWRCLFPKVTMEDIESFADEYRNSDAEVKDLRDAYLRCKGEMGKILTEVPCCTFEDEDRFRTLIDAWIKEMEVPNFPKYSGETEKQMKKRRRKAEKEAAEAAEIRQQMFPDSTKSKSLQVAIQRNQADRSARFLASLEEKYSQPKSKGKSKAKDTGKPSSKRRKQ